MSNHFKSENNIRKPCYRKDDRAMRIYIISYSP